MCTTDNENVGLSPMILLLNITAIDTSMKISIKTIMLLTLCFGTVFGLWAAYLARVHRGFAVKANCRQQFMQFQLDNLVGDARHILQSKRSEKEIEDFFRQAGVPRSVANATAIDLKRSDIDDSEKLAVVLMTFSEMGSDFNHSNFLRDSDNDGLPEIWWKYFRFCLDDNGRIYLVRARNKGTSKE